MKKQFRISRLLLGAALIAELVCFAPDVKAQLMKHTEKGYYLLKQEKLLTNYVKVELAQGDKKDCMKLVRDVNGVDDCFSMADSHQGTKYSFEFTVGEAFEFKKVFWSVNAILKKYFGIGAKSN